jgi:hypothetical protein
MLNTKESTEKIFLYFQKTKVFISANDLWNDLWAAIFITIGLGGIILSFPTRYYSDLFNIFQVFNSVITFAAFCVTFRDMLNIMRSVGFYVAVDMIILLMLFALILFLIANNMINKSFDLTLYANVLSSLSSYLTLFSKISQKNPNVKKSLRNKYLLLSEKYNKIRDEKNRMSNEYLLLRDNYNKLKEEKDNLLYECSLLERENNEYKKLFNDNHKDDSFSVSKLIVTKNSLTIDDNNIQFIYDTHKNPRILFNSLPIPNPIMEGVEFKVKAIDGSHYSFTPLYMCDDGVDYIPAQCHLEFQRKKT